MARYVTRVLLKDALAIPASTTGDHDQLDDAAESISRLIEQFVGFSFHPLDGTRFYRAPNSTRLPLDYPLLAVTSLQTSSDGGSTYGSTLSSNDYYLQPDNATMESPRRPFWELEVRPSATAVLSTYSRGNRITGTWGYYDERRTSTATLATALTATATNIEVNGATALQPGQLILVGTERMFVRQTPASATGAHTSGVLVDRAANGTTGATHSSGAAIQIYEAPIVERAALYQAEQDYRAKDLPLGYAGGEAIGTQRPAMPGDLHPFVRRSLSRFRTPVVG